MGRGGRKVMGLRRLRALRVGVAALVLGAFALMLAGEALWLFAHPSLLAALGGDPGVFSGKVLL